MEPPESNVVGLGGRPAYESKQDLLADYDHCSERRQRAIRRFAHRLAELENHATATVIAFPTK